MTPKTIKRAVAAGVLALLALLGVVVYRAGLNELPPPPTTSTVLEQAIGTGTRGSNDAWRFRAKRVVTSPDGVTTTLEDVESAALYKSGKPYLRLHADRVTINMATRDVMVSGHVTLESVGAPVTRSLRTEVITWNNALQTIIIPTPVTIVSSDGNHMTVGSAQWNVKTGQITVKNVDSTALW